METESQQVVFGKSIIVPSVRELVKEPITKVPPRYVYQQQDPPTVAAADIWLQPVPFIDLHSLLLGDSMGSELEKLHSACKDWGFFQVYTSEPNKGLGWAGLGFHRFDSCSWFSHCHVWICLYCGYSPRNFDFVSQGISIISKNLSYLILSVYFILFHKSMRSELKNSFIFGAYGFLILCLRESLLFPRIYHI